MEDLRRRHTDGRPDRVPCDECHDCGGVEEIEMPSGKIEVRCKALGLWWDKVVVGESNG